MTTPDEQKPPREYFWVPEDAIFDRASDCLGKYPNHGPACLVAHHDFYDKAIRALQEINNGYHTNIQEAMNIAKYCLKELGRL